jgi:hypothetical protein
MQSIDTNTDARLEAAFREIDKALLEAFKGLFPLLKRKYNLTGEEVIAAIAKAEMNNACTALTSTLPGATIEDGLILRAEVRATAAKWWDSIVKRGQMRANNRDANERLGSASQSDDRTN